MFRNCESCMWIPDRVSTAKAQWRTVFLKIFPNMNPVCIYIKHKLSRVCYLKKEIFFLKAFYCITHSKTNSNIVNFLLK